MRHERHEQPRIKSGLREGWFISGDPYQVKAHYFHDGEVVCGRGLYAKPGCEATSNPTDMCFACKRIAKRKGWMQ